MENIAELPATQVTAGQLADLIISRLATQKEEDPSRKYVRGLDSLAKLLQVSTSTIARYKKKGIFGDAIKQNGKSAVTTSFMLVIYIQKKALRLIITVLSIILMI